MEMLILVGLAVAVLASIARSAASQPQPPQVIYYVQTMPAEPPRSSGCLPLLVLAGIALLAILVLG